MWHPCWAVYQASLAVPQINSSSTGQQQKIWVCVGFRVCKTEILRCVDRQLEVGLDVPPLYLRIPLSFILFVYAMQTTP